MLKVQESFRGGLNLLYADTKIDDDSYQWLINGRNRFDSIEPNLKHEEITDRPIGLLQDMIAVGNVLIIFVAGSSYFKRDTDTRWTKIPTFAMSSTATKYWTQTIPGSQFHLVRKASEDDARDVIFDTDFKLNGNPACVIVQDGINQPYIIYYDSNSQTFVSRVTQSYYMWKYKINISTDKREYVPIGKQMMYIDGILFIVSPDSRSIYHSITGRPLDFMVNIDTDGDKMPTEAEGGAASVSFAFDYSEITCIKAVNIQSSFILGTAKILRVITLDYNDTIFGEPKPKTSAIIEAGVVNQDSVLEVSGDYSFIDFDGIKTFNAVQQLKFKGRNSEFSLYISKLIEGVKQYKPICVGFDNYCIYNLETKYGNMLVVYDDKMGRWASFDITTLIDVKKFAIVETDTESKLYAITWNNSLYYMYAADDTECVLLRTKAFKVEREVSGKTTAIEHKGQYVRIMFDGGSVDGTVTLIELVDEQESSRETKTLKANLGGVTYPVIPPVIPDNNQSVNNITFSLSEGLTGKKISYIIIWDNDAKLIDYEVKTSEMDTSVSQRQQNLTYQRTYNPSAV
jgi:hypothetical protein